MPHCSFENIIAQSHLTIEHGFSRVQETRQIQFSDVRARKVVYFLPNNLFAYRKFPNLAMGSLLNKCAQTKGWIFLQSVVILFEGCLHILNGGARSCIGLCFNIFPISSEYRGGADRKVSIG